MKRKNLSSVSSILEEEPAPSQVTRMDVAQIIEDCLRAIGRAKDRMEDVENYFW